MLFSSLSLKVLFGLGTVVGASVLSIHLKNKDTNTGALNSKQGEAVVIPLKPEAVVIPELDEPAMPEPEADITLAQAAKKEIEEIEKIETAIAKNKSDLLHIGLEILLLEEDVKTKETKHQENRVKWKDSATINEEELKSAENLKLAQKKVEDKKDREKKLNTSIKNNNENLSDHKKSETF